MKCAIMQPTYLPWLGYFELMSNCDIFVFLDDVQFVKKSWQQKNRIKTSRGELMLTVPVLTKGKRLQNINEVLINNSLNWRKKHFITIENNYKKAAFFDNYIGELKDIYSKEYSNLLELNLAIIKFLAKNIGIKTPAILSSELKVEGIKNERIINICKKIKAEALYDAAGAKELLDSRLFKKSGIKLIFQEYNHPIYRQLHGDFISHLSVLDLLFNEGKRSLEIINSTGQIKKEIESVCT